MATGPETEERGSGIARKLIVPAAIGAAGSAVGLLLTQRQKVREAAPKLREAVSDLPVPHVPGGGVGELAGDLRGKLDEVLGREPAGDTDTDTDDDGGSRSDTGIDRSELEQRRRERQERRDSRRQRSRR
jgi:hypothetical protein